MEQLANLEQDIKELKALVALLEKRLRFVELKTEGLQIDYRLK